MKRTVSLIIFYTEDWKILLQNRAFKKDPEVEWWFFWWWIEEWETPEQALIRETKEELSYELKEYEFIWKRETYSEKRWLQLDAYIYASPLKDINEFEQKEWKEMMLISPNDARNTLKMLKELDDDTLDIIEIYLDKILKNNLN